MARVFLSYRRGDSGHAGRLYDALRSRFGPENIFMDIDTIEPGVDFADVIDRAVDQCDAFIALIGRGWLDAVDADGRRRLENPDDFVRLELESALERDVVVIPTCVQGAELPSPDRLPASLAPLVRRQAIELRDVGWHDDIGRLLRRLERLAETPKQAAAPPAPPAPREPLSRRPRLLLPALAAIVLLVAAALAFFLLRGGSGGSGGSSSQSLNSSERRLLALVPPITRPSCQQIDYGEPSAKASLECSGVRASAIYNLFSTNQELNAWYAQQRDQEQIAQGTGSCLPAHFRGEAGWAVGGREAGRSFCYVDKDDGESHLVWSDNRVNVGTTSNVWKGKGPAAAASLMRQWRCCFRLQPV